MPIIDMQRRLREAGRIRIGEQVIAKNGKSRPAKLSKFRLTSADQRAIEAAAALYGGEPHQWDGAPVGEQWELYTDTATLPVVIPPADTAFSQWYELWSGGGCQRRCDGARDIIADKPCACDPQNRECSPHTRLNVMLRDLPGVGVWRLETQGYYAAVELSGVAELLVAAATRGQLLPATLRLEQRQVKRPGQQTRNFAVPVLDLDLHLRQIGLLAGVNVPGPELEPTTAPALPAARFQPVPVAELAAPPERTVADQVADAGKERKPRANAAAPIRSTGLKPKGAKTSDEPTPDEDPFRDDETVVETPSLSPAQLLAIACTEAGVTDDEQRHALYQVLTGKSSGKEMLPKDIEQVLAHLARIRAGKVTAANYIDGAIAKDSEIGQAFAESIKSLPETAQAELTDLWKQQGLRWPLAGPDLDLWQAAITHQEKKPA